MEDRARIGLDLKVTFPSSSRTVDVHPRSCQRSRDPDWFDLFQRRVHLRTPMIASILVGIQSYLPSWRSWVTQFLLQYSRVVSRIRLSLVR